MTMFFISISLKNIACHVFEQDQRYISGTGNWFMPQSHQLQKKEETEREKKRLIE